MTLLLLTLLDNQRERSFKPVGAFECGRKPMRAHLLVALAASWFVTGCYYHMTGGVATATQAPDRAGAVLRVSSGINGERGGVGVNAVGTLIDDQSTVQVGVEAFRLWRGQSEPGLKPYLGAAVGVLELGESDGRLLFGGLSPKAEAGMMWLATGGHGISLSAAAEYRFRTRALSTPVLSLQLGFGGFDYITSSQ